MKLLTTLALATAMLAIGVPVSSAGQPDALDRYLQANPPAPVPDAIDRYLWSSRAPSTSGAAGHPDSRAARSFRADSPVPDAIDRYLWSNRAPSTSGAAGHPDSQAVRASVAAEPSAVSDGGRDWQAGALGAFAGVLLALAAITGATVLRDRRRLVLH